ncbi:hypothetical protein BDB01DRAFT_774433, partial [Pilobolus umbonatus]
MSDSNLKELFGRPFSPFSDTKLKHKRRTVWFKMSNLFRRGNRDENLSSISSDQCNSSLDTLDTESSTFSSTSDLHELRKARRRRTPLEQSPVGEVPQLLIPPYSPTYCRPNQFPYSNFYSKLPNGKWMLRYRSGDRNILGTDELEGYL